MPITILRPQPAPQRPRAAEPEGSDIDMDSDSDSSGGADVVEHMPAARRRRVEASDYDDLADEILTPGTVITSNPQWMR